MSNEERKPLKLTGHCRVIPINTQTGECEIEASVPESAKEARDMVRAYLGDSIYASFDGFNVVLTTENGLEPSNTIVLEPQVCQELINFITNIQNG
jgi:hypothetical protein